MCDYSLHGISNRLAKEGEMLIVHQFNTGSKGLTSPEYLKPTAPLKGLLAFLKRMIFTSEPKECAVCIPDGAQLKLEGISQKLQEACDLSAVEMVTFRQLSANFATYRDAVEFGNGMTIRLQELDEGQRMEVQTLSSKQAAAQERGLIRANSQRLGCAQ
jgi:hypothetical protein